MSEITIKALYNYPLKSAQGVLLDKTNVLNTGFEFDRLFGIINIDNVLLTAREKPRLLQLRVSYINSMLQLTTPNNEICNVDLNKVAKKPIEVSLFKDKLKAKLIARVANEYLSQFLKEKVRLISNDTDALRNVKEQYNGQPNDVIAFSDVAPIHLVNMASINDLNSKLEQPIRIPQFRANIVVSTSEAYAEETWKYVKVGECEFEVITPTERCILLTMDPITGQKHPKQEPLRTLIKNKRGSNKVNFGVYLVPRKLGEISVNDTLEVLS